MAAKGRGRGGFFDAIGNCFEGLGALLCCCLFVFICLGPILIVSGVTLLIESTTDSRGSLIDQYNPVVSEWNDGARDAFLGLSFELSGALAGYGSLSQSSASEPGQWSSDATDGSGLTSYTPLKYVYVGIPYGTTKVGYNCTGCSPAVQTVGVAGASVRQSVSATTTRSQCSGYGGTWYSNSDNRRRRYSYSNYDDYDYRRSPDSRARSSHRGSARRDLAADDNGQRRGSSDGTCTYTETISEVCQALEQGSSWANTQGSAGGCSYSGGAFSYYSYKACSSTSCSSTLTLRSSADPYLKALSLTSGTLDFGSTQGQNATSGLVCLVLGCLLLIPCCLGIYMARRKVNPPQQQGVVMAPGPGPAYPGSPTHLNPPYGAHQQPSPMQPPQMQPTGQPQWSEAAAPPAYDSTAHQAAYPAPATAYPQGNYHAPAPAVAMAPPPPMAGLPPGWEAVQDASSGKTYYHQTSTGLTQWEPPHSAATLSV